MKIFLDTADVDLIGQYYGTGLIDGVTTNPTLIKKSGYDPEEVYRKIALIGVDGKAGHIALLERARANSEASCGLYASDDGVSSESLFVSDYKY